MSSDNKYLNKVHKIVTNKQKNVMSKRLPYPDFKNSHADIKLKLLILTCKSMLTLYKSKQTLSVY